MLEFGNSYSRHAGISGIGTADIAGMPLVYQRLQQNEFGKNFYLT